MDLIPGYANDEATVDYLLHPPTSFHAPRSEAAVIILVLYWLLLLIFVLTYSRLVYTVCFNTGLVPRGPQWYAERERKAEAKARHIQRHGKKHGQNSDESIGISRSGSVEDGSLTSRDYRDGTTLASGGTQPLPSLQEFYSKDVFVCQADGRPIWCSTCQNWKPDRAHHCREVEQCVRKMDHFCPWVGGVVSETSFKFFIQFVAWTAVYCIFNLIVTAYFFAEYRRKTHTIDVHWLVTLCLGALFGLFSLGMTGSSVQFAILNTSTIENLSRKSIVWTLAIYMPEPPESSVGFRTITYSVATTSAASGATIGQQPAAPVRTFAILHTKPGENPFDLGPLQNFKAVMGDHWYDWILPIKLSPCCNRDRGNSEFSMGSVVQRMRREAGIVAPKEINDEKPHIRTRHRRRRRHHNDNAGLPDPNDNNQEEKIAPHSGHPGNDVDEIDLEAGLGDTRRFVN